MSSHERTSSWRSPSQNKVEESDEDMFTVPEMDIQQKDPDSGTAVKAEIQQSSSSIAGQQQRRRGRNAADREYRRLKRLLRNRVSAQQARERKKLYVNELEAKSKELQDKNSKLEEKISTLINENAMLRKVLMNTRPKPDENIEPLKDQSGNS